MTYKEVADLIKTIGIPFAYDHFVAGDPDNPAPDPPFICFYYDDKSDDLAADNTNYARIRPLTVELYTDNKDFTMEQTVENALNGAGLVFSRSESYIDTERMYMVAYMTEIVLTEEIKNNA